MGIFIILESGTTIDIEEMISGHWDKSYGYYNPLSFRQPEVSNVYYILFRNTKSIELNEKDGKEFIDLFSKLKENE